MAEGFLKIIFITTKMSKYVRKMKFIISGEIRKNNTGESNQGSCGASSPLERYATQSSHTRREKSVTIFFEIPIVIKFINNNFIIFKLEK